MKFIAIACALALVGGAASQPAEAATFTGTETVDSFCTAIGDNVCKDAFRIRAGLPPITDPVVLTIATPTFAAGDGEFKLTAWGDFNTAGEYVTVHVDDQVFGDFLNNDPDDDLFSDDGFQDGARADIGSHYGQLQAGVCTDGECVWQPPRTGAAIIPQAVLNAIIADGMFTVYLWVSDNVSDGPMINMPQIEEFFTAELTFATAAPTDVPAPAGLLLLLSALVPLGLRRRRG